MYYSIRNVHGSNIQIDKYAHDILESSFVAANMSFIKPIDKQNVIGLLNLSKVREGSRYVIIDGIEYQLPDVEEILRSHQDDFMAVYDELLNVILSEVHDYLIISFQRVSDLWDYIVLRKQHEVYYPIVKITSIPNTPDKHEIEIHHSVMQAISTRVTPGAVMAMLPKHISNYFYTSVRNNTETTTEAN